MKGGGGKGGTQPRWEQGQELTGRSRLAQVTVDKRESEAEQG